MFRKIIVIAGLVLLFCFSLSLLSKNSEKSSSVAVADNPLPEAESKNLYTFNPDNIADLCADRHNVLCAVENIVKCTIKPTLPSCAALHLPRFVFMQGDNVDRPTEISYKITKYTMDANKKASVYTQSTCNASWFGICEGNIVYLLNETPEGWAIEDIYSIEED